MAIKDSYYVMEYGIAEAKNNLPKLVKAAMRGERVVITNHGKDAVELVRVVPKTRKGFGSMPGLTASLLQDGTRSKKKLKQRSSKISSR